MVTAHLRILLATLLLATLASAQPPFACGPFLLRPGSDRMTIVIDHPKAVKATLRYAPVGDDPSHTAIVHAEAERHHIFDLKALRPGTRYWYEVSSDAGLASGRHHFRTLPGETSKYRLVALGDVRTLPLKWRAISRRVFEHEKDALYVIGTGDYPADGRKYQLWVKQFFRPARELLASQPLWPAIGNHEATKRAGDLVGVERSHYFSLFELPGNERWFRVDDHLHTLIILDSNSSMAPGDPQYTWLRATLRSLRRRFTLVAFHHAPYTSGPHARRFPDGTPREWPVDQAQRFLSPLFEQYGVDLVLNGHDHLYERSEKGGIPYIVSGGGGAPLYPINSVPNRYQVKARSCHHYLTLDFSPEAIEMRAVDIDGEVFDSVRFPVRNDTLARREHFLQKAIRDAHRLIAAEDGSARVRLTVRNPLPKPLDSQFQLVEGTTGNDIAKCRLKPGEHKEFVYPSKQLAASGARKPWDPPLRFHLRAHSRSKDAAMLLDFDWSRELTLGSPRYPLSTATGEVDWKSVPAIVLSDWHPVPRGKTGYKGRHDLEATLRMARKEDRLHVRVDVLDPVIHDDGKAPIVAGDSVHLLLTRSRAKTASAALFSLGAQGRALWGGKKQPGLRTHATETKGGYRIEASLPLSLLGPAIFFDLMIVDRDAEGEATSFHRLYTDHMRQKDGRLFAELAP